MDATSPPQKPQLGSVGRSNQKKINTEYEEDEEEEEHRRLYEQVVQKVLNTSNSQHQQRS